MKPRPQPALAQLVAVIALTLAGCGHPEGEGHGHECCDAQHAREAAAGVTFNEQKGLIIPPETAQFIGLQIAGVEQRTMAATFRFSAQVYRVAGEAPSDERPAGDAADALASGSVSPTDATELREGQRVSVQAADDGPVLSGRVVGLRRGLAKGGGPVEVLLAVTDRGRSLAAGAFLSVQVQPGGERRVMCVPHSALLKTAEGDFVYTVSGGSLRRAPVRAGIASPEFFEITHGLGAEDRIVVEPVMTLWMVELQSLRGGKACADGH